MAYIVGCKIVIKIFVLNDSPQAKIIGSCYYYSLNFSPPQAKNLRFCHPKAGGNDPPSLEIFQNWGEFPHLHSTALLYCDKISP